MQLYFQCPENGGIFSTDQYSLIDNHGIITDELGRKRLRAMVAVHSCCPYCRGLHSYPVEEIACPAGFDKNDRINANEQ